MSEASYATADVKGSVPVQRRDKHLEIDAAIEQIAGLIFSMKSLHAEIIRSDLPDEGRDEGRDEEVIPSLLSILDSTPHRINQYCEEGHVILREIRGCLY